MQIEQRTVGSVTILDLKGKITLGEGDEALKDKVIAGAAVDVFADAPRVPATLRALPQVVLTPQIVDLVAPTPVLAAGGIATGRQMAAAMALGAAGALACK